MGVQEYNVFVDVYVVGFYLYKKELILQDMPDLNTRNSTHTIRISVIWRESHCSHTWYMVFKLQTSVIFY
jgi:hypothetical protein